MTILFNDTETQGFTPIVRGTDLYSRTANCILVTYAFDEEPVQAWEPWDEPKIPARLEDGLLDERVRKVAHNATFDRSIFRHALKIPTSIEGWSCTLAQAYAHGLPGSLDLLGIVLNLPEDLRKLTQTGKDLMPFFCIPVDGKFNQPWDYPVEWEKFKSYGIRDTGALRGVYKALPSWNYRNEHLAQWHLDQRINQRGVGFDAAFARAAIDFIDRAKARTDAAVNDATGGAIQAVTQRQKLLDYLTKKFNIDLPNLRASEMRNWLEHDDLDPSLRWLLQTRLEAAKSSGSKYKKGIGTMGPGDRLRNTEQFNGAGRTGRAGGRNFHALNLPRPVLNARDLKTGKMELVPVKAKYIDEVVMPGIVSGAALNFTEVYGAPNEAASIALRHSIVAAPGNELVVADWSNIESRILAWIADETWKLAAYRAVDRGEGVDLYKLLFSQFFGIPISEINDTERQSGKVSELAFGFGGGVGALVTMAATYSIELEPLSRLILPRAKPEHLKKAHKSWRRAFLRGEDYELSAPVYQACDILKQTYRESNAKIDELKHDVDKAIKSAIKNGTSSRVGRCQIWCNGGWLIIQLPGGRRLLYNDPRVEHETDEDENGKPIHREFVTYRTARNKQWQRERAWAGLFIENIVQAIAVDILRGALLRLHADTWSVPVIRAYLETLPEEERTAISLHVYDEAVIDVPVGSYPLARMMRLMIAGEPWSEGLPLEAEGWVGPRYGKRGGKKLRELKYA